MPTSTGFACGFMPMSGTAKSPRPDLNVHFESAGDLIAKYGKTRQIHTLDAIQLAVALSLQMPAPIDHFVCSDQRLCEIALLEGFTVINPEQP